MPDYLVPVAGGFLFGGFGTRFVESELGARRRVRERGWRFGGLGGQRLASAVLAVRAANFNCTRRRGCAFLEGSAGFLSSFVLRKFCVDSSGAAEFFVSL